MRGGGTARLEGIVEGGGGAKGRGRVGWLKRCGVTPPDQPQQQQQQQAAAAAAAAAAGGGSSVCCIGEINDFPEGRGVYCFL